MSTSHTPGPWKAGPPATGLNPSEHRYIHAGGELVARASAGYAPNHRLADQLDANARLIAAAPEMLRALKMLARGGDVYPIGNCWCGFACGAGMEDHGEACKFVRALLAEIEGEK